MPNFAVKVDLQLEDLIRRHWWATERENTVPTYAGKKRYRLSRK